LVPPTVPPTQPAPVVAASEPISMLLPESGDEWDWERVTLASLAAVGLVLWCIVILRRWRKR